MFYPEFTISLWLVSAVMASVFAGVFYAMGAEYVGMHMISFYPEVGTDAITGKEEELLREEAVELRQAA